MNKDNNTFNVAASSLDYSNLIVGLKSEAIKRGYAEMVLQSSTSNKAIFKWKEK